MGTKSLYRIESPDRSEAFKVEDTDGTASIYINGTQLTATVAELNQIHLTGVISDVSTAGQIYLSSPVAGTVSSVRTVLNGAIATADATLTVKNDAGTSMGTITIANASSAAGDKDSLTPSSNNTVAVGDNIEIETDGSSTNAVSVFVTVTITL